MRCPLCNKPLIFYINTGYHELWKCSPCGVIYCRLHDDYNTLDKPWKLIKMKKRII